VSRKKRQLLRHGREQFGTSFAVAEDKEEIVLLTSRTCSPTPSLQLPSPKANPVVGPWTDNPILEIVVNVTEIVCQMFVKGVYVLSVGITVAARVISHTVIRSWVVFALVVRAMKIVVLPLTIDSAFATRIREVVTVVFVQASLKQAVKAILKLPIVQLTVSVVTLNARNVEMEGTVSANRLEGHVMPKTSVECKSDAKGTLTWAQLQVSISNSLQGRTGLRFTGLLERPTLPPEM